MNGTQPETAMQRNAQQPSHRAAHQASQLGLSLVETLIYCLILAVLLSLALPALKDMAQRQRLHGIAQTLMLDLQQARSEAVSGAEAVQFQLDAHTTGSCYVLHTGAPGSCRCDRNGASVCSEAGTALKTQWLSAARSIAIRANVSSLGFQARQGSVTNTGSIDVRIGDGVGIRHIVSIAGRVRSCALGGSIAGLPACQT